MHLFTLHFKIETWYSFDLPCGKPYNVIIRCKSNLCDGTFLKTKMLDVTSVKKKKKTIPWNTINQGLLQPQGELNPDYLRGWGCDRIYDQIPLKIWYTVILSVLIPNL